MRVKGGSSGVFNMIYSWNLFAAMVSRVLHNYVLIIFIHKQFSKSLRMFQFFPTSKCSYRRLVYSRIFSWMSRSEWFLFFFCTFICENKLTQRYKPLLVVFLRGTENAWYWLCYFLVISRKIQKYLSSYYVNLGVSKEVNGGEKKIVN